MAGGTTHGADEQGSKGQVSCIVPFICPTGTNSLLRGIAVGSRVDFEEMNRYLEDKKVGLKPALDKVFKFEDSKEAFEYLGSAKHTGKIVIKVTE